MHLMHLDREEFEALASHFLPVNGRYAGRARLATYTELSPPAEQCHGLTVALHPGRIGAAMARLMALG